LRSLVKSFTKIREDQKVIAEQQEEIKQLKMRLGAMSTSSTSPIVLVPIVHAFESKIQEENTRDKEELDVESNDSPFVVHFSLS